MKANAGRDCWELFDDLALMVDLQSEVPRLTAFMRDTCALLRDCDDGIVRTLLTAADDYRAGRASSEDLKSARVLGWAAVRDAERQSNEGGASTVRVVMPLLYPDDPREDWFDTVWNFLGQAHHAGLDEYTLADVLKRHFAELAVG
jgi:hypothetical protein